MGQDNIQKEVANRLKALRKKLGYTMKEMAQKLDVAVGTYNNYEAGTRGIPLDVLFKLNRDFNVNLNWLISGSEPMFQDELQVIETDTDEVVKLPFYKENFVSAGFGYGNYETKPVMISFSKELLKTIARIDIERGINLVIVYGNSMTPTIPENSIVIVVDYKVEGILREGSIYVVKYNGEEFIKRVFKDPVNKKLKLISDNPEYPPIEVSGEDSDKFKVLGRVIGYLSGV